MTDLTREGQPVHAADAAMRLAVHGSSICRGCRHLGDLCAGTSRSHAAFEGRYRVVVACEQLELLTAP